MFSPPRKMIVNTGRSDSHVHVIQRFQETDRASGPTFRMPATSVFAPVCLSILFHRPIEPGVLNQAPHASGNGISRYQSVVHKDPHVIPLTRETRSFPTRVWGNDIAVAFKTNGAVFESIVVNSQGRFKDLVRQWLQKYSRSRSNRSITASWVVP